MTKKRLLRTLVFISFLTNNLLALPVIAQERINDLSLKADNTAVCSRQESLLAQNNIDALNLDAFQEAESQQVSTSLLVKTRNSLPMREVNHEEFGLPRLDEAYQKNYNEQTKAVIVPLVQEVERQALTTRLLAIYYNDNEEITDSVVAELTQNQRNPQRYIARFFDPSGELYFEHSFSTVNRNHPSRYHPSRFPIRSRQLLKQSNHRIDDFGVEGETTLGKCVDECLKKQLTTWFAAVCLAAEPAGCLIGIWAACRTSCGWND